MQGSKAGVGAIIWRSLLFLNSCQSLSNACFPARRDVDPMSTASRAFAGVSGQIPIWMWTTATRHINSVTVAAATKSNSSSQCPDPPPLDRKLIHRSNRDAGTLKRFAIYVDRWGFPGESMCDSLPLGGDAWAKHTRWTYGFGFRTTFPLAIPVALRAGFLG